jgi:hypothetical protein
LHLRWRTRGHLCERTMFLENTVCELSPILERREQLGPYCLNVDKLRFAPSQQIVPWIHLSGASHNRRVVGFLRELLQCVGPLIQGNERQS